MPAHSALSRRLQVLVGALDAAGWQMRPGQFPGNYRADHPNMTLELPTPQGLGSAWPFPTYTKLRQVWFTVHDGRLTHIMTRTSVPWVHASESTVTLPKALAFIDEVWT